jgi:glycosyltransferase involved in cell wall biosynthesis
VHGNYLYSLTQAPHDFIVPAMPDNRPGYAALGSGLPWGSNLRQIPAAQLRDEDFDCIVFQSRAVYEKDRFELLSPAQLALPCVYIEHNPPEPHPTDSPHFFNHDRGLLVHVTDWNALMWDSGDVRTRVLEHGVVERAGVCYSGELAAGIAVINHLSRRGRRLGADIYKWSSARVALELIGMESELMGGNGEVPNMKVAEYIARYRFFFTPIRYASLGLSLIEAMLAGLPIVGVAATELPSVVTNGVNGYLDTRPERLLDCMNTLLQEPELARRWGLEAQKTARQRFGIERFVRDWDDVFLLLTEMQNA